jgi:hypothetical protein
MASFGEGLTAVGISEVAERERRDFTSGTIHFYDSDWNLLDEWPMSGEGLVLDIKSFP